LRHLTGGERSSHSETKAAQTLDRAMDLLRHVAGSREAGASLSELIRASGLTKPTTRRLLISLIENGLVEQREKDRRYYVGAETYALGMMASSRFGIERLAVESLRRLAKRSGDAALLTIQSGYQTVCVGREEGDFPLRSHVLQPGHRHPLGVGAAGLALLAAMPDEEIEWALSANESVLSRNYTYLHPSVLKREVTRTRKRGYAVNPGMVVKGSWGVAVALRDLRSGVPAALTIAGIESRFQNGRIEQLVAMLEDEKRVLKATLHEACSGGAHAAAMDGKLTPYDSAQSRRSHNV
jgi:DNA-binding IclR family transcriptional regulator